MEVATYDLPDFSRFGDLDFSVSAIFYSIAMMVFSRRAYYNAKPFLPLFLRSRLRRVHALWVLRHSRGHWPITRGSERPPDGWPGWPQGRQCALVLTHDVEGQRGLDRVRELAELEMRLGFRSSFNFVPEGAYRVTKDLRDWLTDNGFEVGVHDFRHDGKLFRSRESFAKHAQLINHYLKEWNAVGFRSAYMLRNLQWIHGLNIAYDTSTFDTDPFEPQPEGTNTIFPFWLPRDSSPGFGYAELPYTLVQDSTLFLALRERTDDIWRKKLDWIVKRGGMALLNTHPDYMQFDGSCVTHTFPASRYEDFLGYIKSTYAGQYWHPLPREIAEFVHKNRNVFSLRTTIQSGETCRPQGRKIWIDLDNTPHVPFFKPIIKELQKRGYTVVVTVRDAFQTCELATRSGLNFTKVGRHYGKNPLLKVFGLIWRSLQLLPFVVRERPVVGLSHGSRAQILLCNLLHIPTIMIIDYEYAQTMPGVRPGWEIVPDVLSSEDLHCKTKERIRTYRGIKEDVYAAEFRPDPSIIEQLGLNGDVIVTVRPPATEAHYHNPESDQLFVQFMQRLTTTKGTKAILLPRNKSQENELRKRWPQWFEGFKVVVPKEAVDGLNLLWHSDFVVSGGGTMNREAAALNVPVYSIFRGKIGAVDRRLQSEGRLILIESVEEVQTRIEFRRRDKSNPPENQPRQALRDIVDHVEEIVRTEYPGTMTSVRYEGEGSTQS
jgi:uncharacterized protein